MEIRERLEARKAIFNKRPEEIRLKIVHKIREEINPFLEIAQGLILESTTFLKSNEKLSKSCLKSIDETLMMWRLWRLISFKDIDDVAQMISDKIDKYEKLSVIELGKDYEKEILKSAKDNLENTLYYLNKIQWEIEKKQKMYQLFEKSPEPEVTYLDSFVSGIARHLEKTNKYKVVEKSEEIKKANNIKENIAPQTLRDLFVEPFRDHIDKFLSILKNTDDLPDGLETVLSEGNRWIGNKQVAMVFYKELLALDIVVKVSNATVGRLFEAHFKNLNKSFSSQSPGEIANDYKEYFNIEINRIRTKIT